MQTKMKIILILTIAAGSLFAPSTHAQFAIDWFTIAGGGGTSTGGPYAVSGTIGQPITGESTGGTFTIEAGFWSVESLIGGTAGIESADSLGQHGAQGRINLPLNLAGQPTSDPRLTVKEILVVFGIPVQPSEGNLIPAQVIVTSSPSTSIPAYTLSFAEGGNIGQELTILFSQPLPDQHRYRISFEQFVDADGDPLSGDTDLEFRVLQGDANNNGAVTATDVSFVRSRINETAAFGATSRADVNMSGSITGPDVSFVRSRIGHSAP
jgi:hypothetical protein